MALVSLLFEFVPAAAAAAAKEAPLPGAFLEFLAEMVEEEGELLDPLVLMPEPRPGEQEPVRAPETGAADASAPGRNAAEEAADVDPAGDAQASGRAQP